MSIKDYLQKKKDPEGYLQKRAHEILRELEDIVAEISPKMDKQNAKIDLYTAKSDAQLQELKQLVETTTAQIKEKINGKTTELDTIILNFEQKIQKIFSERDALYKNELSHVFSKIQEKIAEVKLMKGEKGDKGDKGKQGENGSPDTPDQIANKLNTTKETIDASVIKGLLKTIEELKRAIRNKEKGGGGGGGMGNIQHETKDVSSGTTTVTTTYAISQNGYGIMGAYYQGQLIMRGEHYTVGGDRKTLTLAFVPQDSTKIDIVYVRG